jgi:hypothetical protein
VLSAQLKISDIGRARRAYRIHRQMPNLVVYVLTMSPVVPIPCSSASNDFSSIPLGPFSIISRYEICSFRSLDLSQYNSIGPSTQTSKTKNPMDQFGPGAMIILATPSGLHVFTMCPDIQISCLSASNDFDPTIIMHFLINSRYDALSDIFSWIT